MYSRRNRCGGGSDRIFRYRLGLGDKAGDAETLVPVPKLQNKKCVSIAAGTSSSFAVTDNGKTVIMNVRK